MQQLTMICKLLELRKSTNDWYNFRSFLFLVRNTTLDPFFFSRYEIYILNNNSCMQMFIREDLTENPSASRAGQEALKSSDFEFMN